MDELDGLLPEWAERVSDGDYMTPQTQLLTRDGRRTGNAVVLRTEVCYGFHVAVVQTDAGNIFKMTAAELEGAYHKPIYVLKRTLLSEIVDQLRQWKCTHCGGNRTYLNRSRTSGTARIPCKFCQGSGLHSTAAGMIAKFEGTPDEGH